MGHKKYMRISLLVFFKVSENLQNDNNYPLVSESLCRVHFFTLVDILIKHQSNH